MKFKDAIKEYKTYLVVEKGVSENTLKAYIRDIIHFSNMMMEKYQLMHIEDVDKENMRLYINSLRSLSSLSVSRKIVSLRNFYKFLTKERYVKENIMASFELPKPPKKLPQVLSEEEIARLLDQMEMTDFISARNKAMIELLYASGLRVSELVNIEMSQLNIKMGYLRVIGKGDKERMVPLNEYVCDVLNTYIMDYRYPTLDFKDVPYLFFNKKFKKVSRESFYKILREEALKAGITKQISPHTIRHTYATHLLENDADLRSIQELLGHSDISTTTIYTHISNKKMMEDYNKFHLRSNKDDTDQN